MAIESFMTKIGEITWETLTKGELQRRSMGFLAADLTIFVLTALGHGTWAAVGTFFMEWCAVLEGNYLGVVEGIVLAAEAAAMDPSRQLCCPDFPCAIRVKLAAQSWVSISILIATFVVGEISDASVRIPVVIALLGVDTLFSWIFRMRHRGQIIKVVSAQMLQLGLLIETLAFGCYLCREDEAEVERRRRRNENRTAADKEQNNAGERCMCAIFCMALKYALTMLLSAYCAAIFMAKEGAMLYGNVEEAVAAVTALRARDAAEHARAQKYASQNVPPTTHASVLMVKPLDDAEARVTFDQVYPGTSSSSMGTP